MPYNARTCPCVLDLALIPARTSAYLVVLFVHYIHYVNIVHSVHSLFLIAYCGWGARPNPEYLLGARVSAFRAPLAKYLLGNGTPSRLPHDAPGISTSLSRLASFGFGLSIPLDNPCPLGHSKQ